MRRIWIAIAALSAVASQAAPPADATALLAAAPESSSAIEIKCVLPDMHLEVRRRTISQGPMGSFDMTTYEGVASADPIHDVVAPDAPFPVWFPGGPPPATPAAIAAAREKQATRRKLQFARLLAPLFAQSFAGYPMQFAAGSGTADADVIDVTGPGGARFQLRLDRTSHLPARVVWKDRPVIVMSRSSVLSVGPGGERMAGGQPVCRRATPPQECPMPIGKWPSATTASKTE